MFDILWLCWCGYVDGSRNTDCGYCFQPVTSNLGLWPWPLLKLVISVIKETDMTLGEMQALRVLTTLQYLAKVGPKSPPAGQIAQSVQSIMQPLQQADISFMPHAALGYAVLTRSRGTSVETDVSFADISSLPSSVGLAGDMPRPSDQPKPGDSESAMGEMMLESASLTRAVELDVKVIGRNLETEAQEDGVNKE